MGTKSTFQGYVRTYGGQDKSSGVTPGVLVASEVITFLSSTTTATAVSVNYFDKPSGSTTSVFSHYNCGPPTFTIEDASGTN